MLLMTAVFADALVPNLQEKCLKELKYPVGRMIVYSNGCAASVLLYCSATGELSMALKWCASNTEGSAFLFLRACTSYMGLRCYLVVVVGAFSGVVGVVTTSLRKVATLILSFLLFGALTQGHAWSFVVLFAGVGLATYARQVK